MSAFYGQLVGGRGDVTRTGTKNSGFKSTCQSYDGSVITRMRYDREDNLEIIIELSDGSSFGGWDAKEYFRGSLDELREALRTYTESKTGRVLD